ncbi:MAG: NADH-quinone oxidoreductase subunit M [Betaproteobacteria bacterium]|nr:MAG: NADH-quinone oxidoreductase subunit M [Betaproteobacteria bacterium]
MDAMWLEMPLLSLLFMTLPIGAALTWFWPRPEQARVIALGTALLDLVIVGVILSRFDPTQAGYQLVEQARWIPSLPVNYLVGVDGLSVFFLPTTVLLFIGVIVASWNTVMSHQRLFFSLLLLLETTTLGIFCALDTVLFFLFWELSLVPLYFLISLWGVGPNRRYAAMKYAMVMLAGGAPLLLGFVLLAFNHADLTGALAFDLPSLLATPVPIETERVVFALLFLGFAVKMPVFPLHTWFPVVAMEGPVAVVALLAGLKLGVYGLIRFAIPLAPAAALEWHWVLAGLGTVAILYGAVAALAQTNLRRMMAYSSLSHVGLIVLALSAFNVQGLQGAVLQLLNFTLVAGGLFIATSFLYQRVGSSDVLSLGGAARSMPILASLFLVLGLASLGLPGTSGFPAELLMLIAALKTHTGAGLAALFGMVLGAAYFLSLYRRAFFGPITSPVVRDAVDLLPRERAVLLVFVGLVIAIGLAPGWLLEMLRPAAELWVARLAMG